MQNAATTTSATQLYLRQKIHRSHHQNPGRFFMVNGIEGGKAIEIELCELRRGDNFACPACERFVSNMKERGWTTWQSCLSR